MIRRKRLGLAAALASLLTSGCYSVGPDFAPPDPLLPRASFFGKPEPQSVEEKAAAAVAAEPSSAPADAAWWRKFRDPTLTSLIDRVADANLDVVTATVRLGESRNQREVFSKNGVLSLVGPIVNIPPISVWQTGFDASWELDIWGHVRRQVEAAD